MRAYPSLKWFGLRSGLRDLPGSNAMALSFQISIPAVCDKPHQPSSFRYPQHELGKTSSIFVSLQVGLTKLSLIHMLRHDRIAMDGCSTFTKLLPALHCIYDCRNLYIAPCLGCSTSVHNAIDFKSLHLHVTRTAECPCRYATA